MAKPRAELWWKQPRGDAHEAIFSYVRCLEQEQVDVHERNLQAAHLYSSIDAYGLRWTTTQRSVTRGQLPVVTKNIIKNVTDTAAALIGKQMVRARFETDGADFSMQRLSDKKQKLSDGLAKITKFRQKRQAGFRDQCVFGTMALEIGAGTDMPYVERVLIDDLIVDEQECRSTPPRQIHRRMFVDRDKLLELYPKFESSISTSGATYRGTPWASGRRVPDQVLVVIKSWYLGTEGRGGRHTVTIDNATLVDREYTRDYFPFVIDWWTPPLCGFYGTGIPFDLAGIQLRINKSHRFMQKCLDLIAVPRVFVDVTAKLLKAQINDEIGSIVPTRGKAPTFYTPQNIITELWNYTKDLENAGYEMTGISRLAAQAHAPPPGIDSAPAIREYNDVATDRFAPVAQRYEMSHVEGAEMLIDVAKDMFGHRKKEPDAWRGHDFLQQVPWDEIDMKHDRFFMSVEAGSVLSKTPAGRRAEVIELARQDFLSRDEARELLGHPDIDANESLATAARKDIKAAIANVRDGKYEAPDEFQDLEQGVTLFTLAMLEDKRRGAPEQILEAYRTWIEQAKAIQERAKPAPPMLPPGMPGQDAGVPMPGMPPGAPQAGPPGPAGPQMPMPPMM